MKSGANNLGARAGVGKGLAVANGVSASDEVRQIRFISQSPFHFIASFRLHQKPTCSTLHHASVYSFGGGYVLGYWAGRLMKVHRSCVMLHAHALFTTS